MNKARNSERLSLSFLPRLCPPRFSLVRNFFLLVSNYRGPGKGYSGIGYLLLWSNPGYNRSWHIQAVKTPLKKCTRPSNRAFNVRGTTCALLPSCCCWTIVHPRLYSGKVWENSFLFLFCIPFVGPYSKLLLRCVIHLETEINSSQLDQRFWANFCFNSFSV